jgi:DNA-binding transcriptional LysR family regulator
MALDLQDLEVFLAVEAQGSFGRAATSLLVSQPAVSERVRNLERTVGRTLFERTARGARLTTAGRALVPYARRCVALAEESVDAARRADGVDALVVAVHSTFAQRVVPFVLGALGGTPRRVTVRDAHSDEVAALVADGTAHLGFAIAGASTRGVRRVGLPPDPVVCAVGRDHPLGRRARPTVASLRDALLAVNGWGAGAEAFSARLARAGVDDWRVRACGDAATALVLARDYGHVAFVARSSVGATTGVRTVALAGLGDWRVRLDLLFRPALRTDAAVAAVIAARSRA